MDTGGGGPPGRTPPNRYVFVPERLCGGSSWHGYLHSFTPPATAGSRPAAHTRPAPGRRLGQPWCGGLMSLTLTARPAGSRTRHAPGRSTGLEPPAASAGARRSGRACSHPPPLSSPTGSRAGPPAVSGQADCAGLRSGLRTLPSAQRRPGAGRPQCRPAPTVSPAHGPHSPRRLGGPRSLAASGPRSRCAGGSKRAGRCHGDTDTLVLG